MSVASRIFLPRILLFGLITSFWITPLLHASDTVPESVDISATDPTSSDSLSDELRWYIKRQVMSKPGVMLDMANMTDSGYVWTNDVVWMGSGVPVDEPWYIAGFVFQRPGYKKVWLQYAFTFTQETGELGNFKRWYGAGTFR